MEDLEIRDVGMLVIAAAITGAWLLAMLAVRILRQPLEPDAGPNTSELGPEPPAVANMLANGFRARREAVPATLLDLATRQLLELQGIGDMYAVHVPEREPGGDLTAYERRIIQVLRDRAEHGIVPAGALTTGPAERARAWWKGFRKEVESDAKARGLSRDLWPGSFLTVLLAPAVIAAAFVYLAFEHLGPAVAYGFVALVFIETVRQGRRQRHTEAGLKAAARWLGVRRFVRESAFADLPPTAVEIWGRHLAYGAALGAARTAVRAIPMGAEEARRAWSSYGGRWREVRIRYPWLWPPAWGMHPGVALLTSLGVGAFAAVWFFLAFGEVGLVSWLWDFPAGRVAAGVFVVVTALIAAWALITLIRAVSDMGSREEIAGLVLRLRELGGGENREPRCYVAIDDGRAPTIRALRVRPELYRFAPLEEYTEATATVTHNLRYVRDIRR